MPGSKRLLIIVLIFLLLIGLSARRPAEHQGKTPWNIQVLDDEHIHVFGMTPGKTSIQEANQILGHFAATRLYNTDPPRLLARHEKIMLGKSPASMDLVYLVDETDLASLQQALHVYSDCQPAQLSEEDEIRLLSNPIDKIIYTPETDYSVGDVSRHLGDADEQIETGEQTRLLYRRFQLLVYINSKGPDVFIYGQREPAATSTPAQQ